METTPAPPHHLFIYRHNTTGGWRWELCEASAPQNPHSCSQGSVQSLQLLGLGLLSPEPLLPTAAHHGLPTGTLGSAREEEKHVRKGISDHTRRMRWVLLVVLQPFPVENCPGGQGCSLAPAKSWNLSQSALGASSCSCQAILMTHHFLPVFYAPRIIPRRIDKLHLWLQRDKSSCRILQDPSHHSP